MKFNQLISSVVLVTSVAGMASASSQDPMVGGKMMSKRMTIVQNALNSPIHTTLVAAVKAAGLVDALNGTGPMTVFAPTNDAFENLPSGMVEMALKPENKAMLTKVLTYHVVAGTYDSMKLREMIKKGNGKAMLKTLSGGTLTFMMNGPTNVLVMDEKGGSATISTYDVYQSNGVIHVVDSVLMPN